MFGSIRCSTTCDRDVLDGCSAQELLSEHLPIRSMYVLDRWGRATVAIVGFQSKLYRMLVKRGLASCSAPSQRFPQVSCVHATVAVAVAAAPISAESPCVDSMETRHLVRGKQLTCKCSGGARGGLRLAQSGKRWEVHMYTHVHQQRQH